MFDIHIRIGRSCHPLPLSKQSQVRVQCTIIFGKFVCIEFVTLLYTIPYVPSPMRLSFSNSVTHLCYRKTRKVPRNYQKNWKRTWNLFLFRDKVLQRPIFSLSGIVSFFSVRKLVTNGNFLIFGVFGTWMSLNFA